MTASSDRSNLQRLLQPRSIAVIGGGAWCANVIRECRKIGFVGEIWPVHPKRDEVGDLPTFKHINDLPGAPDAAFIGVNRALTVEAVRLLSARGTGGAVCFASGFSEAQAELGDGADLQQALLDAAGDMRLLGPNCYGFVNALDCAALWPDQHGMQPVERGVAILTQSSNIALNLTMQTRGLPIAYLGTLGNQAQTDLAELGATILEDPRVTALGLHIEGLSDLRGFEVLARRAFELGKRIVAVKIGASEQASAAAVSHTASLSGSDAGARALLKRLGIAQVGSLAGLMETLKILHCRGPLAHGGIASMSCSGGEASLVADSVLGTELHFPALSAQQQEALRGALGPKVALANPLDYHTYIWGDQEALTGCFSAMMSAGNLALGIVVLDFPRADRCDAREWDIVVNAVADTAAATGATMAIMTSLPECMPENIAQDLMTRGVIPICGFGEGLEAVAAAAWLGENGPASVSLLLPSGGKLMHETTIQTVLAEGEAKKILAQHGLAVPRSKRARTPREAGDAAAEIGFPIVLKGEGFAHKTEAGAVKLGLTTTEDVIAAAVKMNAAGYLVEQMVPQTVAELLIGVMRDPAHGFVLTLGAGGILTEILQDTVSLLLPVDETAILTALHSLRIAPMLAGYRGAVAAEKKAICQAVLAVQAYVKAQAGRVAEVEINPLLCGPDGAIAVDALIRLED
ncbi:acetate--CoA ligase family protein [Tropicibacter sp. R15_0]|uniref:acetate--CoA ligase family protein n=1 Tax=Tropicibacter sp. R15_0 TaxID=2821101 RepID=UPI001AD9FD14|nr:acetate--CoA ligase family protein [Tropicibacter sp. R15_0]MBO9467474.1 acetate--CoA ligase family protein [Tropicibacter sp. R15_0]